MSVNISNNYLEEAQIYGQSVLQCQVSLIQAWIDWSGDSESRFYLAMGPTFIFFLPLEIAKQVCLIVEPLLKGLGHLFSWGLSCVVEEESSLNHLDYARYQLWDSLWGCVAAGAACYSVAIEVEIGLPIVILIFVLNSTLTFDDVYQGLFSDPTSS